ncbi:MAG: MmgE/PrpD family protein [Chloroflexi bacterium]|nr:MmgE/PrpD family protein [Chloroflexota bacterium]
MSRQAAEFIVDLDLARLPQEVVRAAKLHILDAIGCAVGASRTTAARAAVRFAEGLGRSNEATVLLTGKRASVPAATFANCVAASALDYEDGGMLGGFHPGSGVVAPALTLGEREDSPGRDVVLAVVAGYEVGLRHHLMAVLLAGDPWGAGATGTMAGVGAAAAAAKLLKLDATRTLNALGIGSCTRPVARDGGMPQFGSMVKEAIGWGGITGVSAALLAQKGYTGGFTTLGGRVDGREEHPYYPLDGRDWFILKTYFKAYSACRFTHAALDCVLQLKAQHSLKADDVARVVVGSTLRASTLNTQRPANLEQAQYSFPFVIGCALLYGRATPDEVAEERLNEPAILEQAAKVHVQTDPEVQSYDPRRHPARVRIETRSGQVLTTFKLTATGDFDEPMSEERLRAKFMALAAPAIGEENARKVMSLVENLEQVGSVREVVGLLGVGAAVR